MILTDDEVWSLWNSQATDDMNMQEAATFARAIESAVLRKLRERPADAYIQTSRTEQELEWQKDEEMEGFYVYTPLHIIPEVNE